MSELIRIDVILLVLAGIIFGIHKFNVHCKEKFAYKFFTIRSFIAITLAPCFTIGGYRLYTRITSDVDTIYGIMLVIIGLCIFGRIVYNNFRRTNLKYGIIGSMLQIGLFIFIALIIFFIISILILIRVTS